MSGGSQPSDLRAIAASPYSFEAFYRQHVEAVQRFVARRVCGREHAADLTAEVFVAAIESAAAFRPTRNGSAVAWLYAARTLRRQRPPPCGAQAGRDGARGRPAPGRRGRPPRMDERLDVAAGV